MMSRRHEMLRKLDQDIRDHIEHETQDNIERGMSPEEARCAALRRFGNIQLVKEDTRAVWIAAAAEQVWQDAKYGLRSMWHEPIFTATAILTLAIGIAVNTAVFSVVNAVVLRALPYPDADRLVVFSNGTTASRASHFKPGIAGADFAEWRARATSFDKLAGYTYADQTIARTNVADQVRVISLAGDFWAIVGAHAVLGHLFKPEGAQNEAVLSYSLFEHQFKGDRRIVGRVITLDGNQLRLLASFQRTSASIYPRIGGAGSRPPKRARSSLLHLFFDQLGPGYSL